MTDTKICPLATKLMNTFAPRILEDKFLLFDCNSYQLQTSIANFADWCVHSLGTLAPLCFGQGLIGNGQAHVHTVVGLAQAALLDGEAVPAVRRFASLGAFGKCPSNEERDLHRWLKDFYGVSLEVSYIPLTVHAPQPNSSSHNLLGHAREK